MIGREKNLKGENNEMHLMKNQKVGDICRKEGDQKKAGQETWRRAVIEEDILEQSIMSHTYGSATVKHMTVY